MKTRTAPRPAGPRPTKPRPTRLGPKLQRAFAYAAKMHAGQARKGTKVPYLSHLMAVASLVLEAGGDEEMAIAALLHDVVEDCGGMPRLREIRKVFGNAWPTSSRAARIRSAIRSQTGLNASEAISKK